MQTGFHRVITVDHEKNMVYYDLKSGKMLHNQQHIGKYWYAFKTETGAMLTGFRTVTDSKAKKTKKVVYYNVSGHMVFGWQQLNRHRYYFNNSNGKRVTGKVKIGNKTYSFSKTGILSCWIERTINWFVQRKGKITYSMYGSRNGNDGTADCSGSMTQAIWKAGASRPASESLRWVDTIRYLFGLG